MNILVTNDDGIKAEGVKSIAAALAKSHNVLLVAPDNERSGSGHSTSLSTPIKYKKINLIEGIDCFELSGTPADCVKFGINFLAKDKIDFVVSGINHGRNLGTDVLYSGTVSAALEALIAGYGAIAVSYSGLSGYNFSYASEFISKNLNVFYQFTKHQIMLNINFPKCDIKDIKGVKITPLGRERYNDKYEVYKEGTDEGYILAKLPHIKAENPNNSDIVLNTKKYVTVTPLHLDITDYKALKRIKGKQIKL